MRLFSARIKFCARIMATRAGMALITLGLVSLLAGLLLANELADSGIVAPLPTLPSDDID